MQSWPEQGKQVKLEGDEKMIYMIILRGGVGAWPDLYALWVQPARGGGGASEHRGGPGLSGARVPVQYDSAE